MKVSSEGIALIMQFESLRLSAYQDVKGIWTIGYGTTCYPNGKAVKSGDKITISLAANYLAGDIQKVVAFLNKSLATIVIKQNQFDALISFGYNVGLTAMRSSTLLKLVQMKPDNPVIRSEFMRWVHGYVEGKFVIVKGLVNRRIKEADKYFS